MDAQELEDYVAKNLGRLFPSLKLSARNRKLSGKREVDLYARNGHGREYFIEVKAGDCNRVIVGQMVDYRASLPRGELILVCRKADKNVRKVLGKADIEVKTFDELGIPQEAGKHKPRPKGLSPTEQSAYFSLIRKGLNLVGVRDLALAIDTPYNQAKNLLVSLAKEGVAYRVGRGKYVLIAPDVLYGRKSFVADPLTVINRLMSGCDYYVSYQSAAHYHGLAEQLPFRTNVAVLKQKRSVLLGNASVGFVTLNPKKFFGYEAANYLQFPIKVSDLEKTLVDCVDRPEMCGGIDEVAKIMSNALDRLDGPKLVSYVKRMESRVLAQRIGLLLERLGKGRVAPRVMEKLHNLRGSFTYLLDPKEPRKGQISKKWLIRENVKVGKA